LTFELRLYYIIAIDEICFDEFYILCKMDIIYCFIIIDDILL
jgi:hypothetical protein